MHVVLLHINGACRVIKFRYIYIYKVVSFPPVSPPRPYTLPSPHPYAPHAQPISFFSILSPAQYWVSSTNHLAPRYAISSITPLPFPSSVQIFSSTPCSQTPSKLVSEYITSSLLSGNLKIKVFMWDVPLCFAEYH